MATGSVLSWGILGAARVNERLLPAILEANNAELVAVASRRQGAAAEIVAKFAEEPNNIDCLDDPEALLNRDDIDAIYLPMANDEHAEWALKVINTGKHVLIEKPMALKVDDIEAICTALTQHHVLAMEGFMYCFHPQHDYVKKLIDSGKIGQVRTVKTCYSFPMKPARMYRLAKNIQNGGGALWDIGPYAIHSARKWFDNEPVAVTAMAKIIESGADTSLSGVFDFEGGKYAHFDISFERARRSKYEIIGTLGGINCNTVWQHYADEPIISYWTDDGEQEEVSLLAANHFVLEIEHFSDCVLNGKPAQLTMQDAKDNCKAMVAVMDSIQLGKTVTIA